MTRLTQPSRSSRAWERKSNALHKQLRMEIESDMIRDTLLHPIFLAYAGGAGSILFLFWWVVQ